MCYKQAVGHVAHGMAQLPSCGRVGLQALHRTAASLHLALQAVKGYWPGLRVGVV